MLLTSTVLPLLCCTSLITWTFLNWKTLCTSFKATFMALFNLLEAARFDSTPPVPRRTALVRSMPHWSCSSCCSVFVLAHCLRSATVLSLSPILSCLVMIFLKFAIFSTEGTKSSNGGLFLFLELQSISTT